MALALLLVFKLRRVAPRIGGGRSARGVVALAAVAAVLVSGAVWSTAGGAVAGFTVLVWHGGLGALLGLAVLAHALLRAKRPRRRDLADRRQFLTAAAVGGLALAAWQLQR